MAKRRAQVTCQGCLHSFNKPERPRRRVVVPFRKLRETYREELWERLGCEADLEGECTVYRRHPSRNGYGRLSIHGVLQPAHRFAYQYVRGAIEDHLEVHHSCYNTACVRIAHLSAVTRAVNAELRRTHGFHHKGSRRSKRWGRADHAQE